ncbi:hypothetical protein J2X68_006627 [Streptomyces sp. 3330]|uniref:hypothetical protein n=1 Tax=Streptomyces sp. 3330 TaxID=2817755 RepID=UPI00286745F2|nr:hypothetical protein [Streptomyces sp. 3330]MDR6979890.1 hypothetical protein [Streptomyces sp. 3330]
MRDWQKVLLALDRRFGSGQPPSRLEVKVARHPVRAGVIFGAVLAASIAWTLSGSDDPVVLLQASLIGAGMGVLCWAALRAARWQHAYDERTGRFDTARQQDRRAELKAVSPTRRALLLAGKWLVISSAIWMISPLIDMPRSIPWAALSGILFVGAVITAGWIKRTRS